MISTGNDIVSLAAIDVTRTRQLNFYSKILSDSEKAGFTHADFAGLPFENFVWLLWSIKESAYKYLQRHNPGLVFTPIKFVVSNVHVNKGHLPLHFDTCVHEGIGFKEPACIKATINFGERALYSCSLLYDQLIHSVVNHNVDFENVCWGIEKIEDDSDDHQSKEVRALLLRRLKNVYPGDDFFVEKNASGCPVLMRGAVDSGVPVSLSHHGCFVGYTFENSDFRNK